MRRVLTIVWVCALFLLSACQVDTQITVEVADGGSGHVIVDVVLDAEAVAQVPGMADQLRTADVAEAGWAVDGPSATDDGGLNISAAKSFANPQEGAAVLGEVTGGDGPLSDLALSEDRSFGQVSYEFSGQADLSDGVEAFADQELTALLDGQPFGGNTARLEEATGAPLDEQFSLALTVEMPGGAKTWDLVPGAEPTDLALSTSEIRPLPWLLGVLAVVAIIGAFLLAMTRLTRWVSNRRAGVNSQPSDESPTDPAAAAPSGQSGVEGGSGATPEAEAAGGIAATAAAAAAMPGDEADHDDDVAASDPDGDRDGHAAETDGTDEGVAPPAAAEAGDDRKLQLVVLDADGVVFSTIESADDLLVEFAGDHGSQLDGDVIRRTYHAASEGQMTTGELWQSLGVVGDPGDLSDEFLSEHRVTDGVREFLERMRARGLPVAVIGNEVGEWSRKLRVAHRLDPLTVTWLSSGDVGERLPGPALYQRVLQVTEIDARNGLFISTHTQALDAARSYGFAAAWFRPDEPEGVETHTYPVLRSFSDLGIGD